MHNLWLYAQARWMVWTNARSLHWLWIVFGFIQSGVLSVWRSYIGILKKTWALISISGHPTYTVMCCEEGSGVKWEGVLIPDSLTWPNLSAGHIICVRYSLQTGSMTCGQVNTVHRSWRREGRLRTLGHFRTILNWKEEWKNLQLK